MKNFTLLLLLIGFIYTSCKKNDLANEESIKKSAYLIQNDESRELFKKRVDIVMGITDDFEFSLTEITTDEMFSKTGCQVYKVSCGITGLDGNCFVIRKDKTTFLWNAAYGNTSKDSDFDHMIVCDLNNDASYELMIVSTLSWPSSPGIPASPDRVGIQLAPCERDHYNGGGVYKFLASPSYSFYLEKESDQRVFIRYKDNITDIRLGEITSKEEYGVNIKLNSEVSKDLMLTLGINYSY